MSEQLTPAQKAYRATMAEAVATYERLMQEGRKDRAAGLAVGIDLGVSAAFLFTLDDRAYEDATNVVRQAITQATREEG